MRVGGFAPLCLTAALLAQACSRDARAAIPESVLRGAWCEVRTTHIRVLTDAGGSTANYVAERLERLHEQVARTLPALAAGSGRPRTVFVFAHDDAFRAYVPLFQGRPEEDDGIFQPGPDRDWLLFDDGPQGELDRVALHEYTHALVSEVAPNAPLWLNEGLAQYFSTLRVDAADVRVGEPAPEAVAWLRGHELLPMEALLSLNYASPDYHGGERRSTFYAESWLLVHMLLNESTADLPRWAAYLAALHRGDEPRAAFRSAFGGERELYWRLEMYAHRPSFGAMNWGFSQPFASLTVASRWRVPNAEVVSALGGMVLWQHGADLGPAQEHATAAVALGPAEPSTQALCEAITARSAQLAAAAVQPAGSGQVTTTWVVRPGGEPPWRGPLTEYELARVTALVQSGEPDETRTYLRALLARELRPGQRRSIERLLRLLGQDASGR